MTDPGAYAASLDSMPKDIRLIKSLLDGLILHFWDGSNLYDYQIPFKRLFDIETRYVSIMLKKILDLDPASLTVERSLENKIVGSCRDYSTLFCSILRRMGIPARTRVAFSTYHYTTHYHDTVILEYWDVVKNKWCLVDTRTNESLMKKFNLTINFDLFDVPRDKLVVAGLAWQMVRDNKACAEMFCGGDCKKNKGLWYVRDRLVQDFAAINSMEMLLWDAWGLMLTDQNIEKNPKQLYKLDKIAKMTIDPDLYYNSIRHQFAYDVDLKVPDQIISFSPVYKRKMIDLGMNIYKT